MSLIADLGSPLGIIDMNAGGDVEAYARWVGETQQGIAPECGALTVRAASEDPKLGDLMQETEAGATI